MRTNHNASGKPSLEGCVGLRYQLRLVLQATYPWVCGILTVMIFTLNDDDKLVRRLLISRLCLQVVADWIFIYLAFKRGMFAENMMFIIGMFGCGMLVHMAASILMYKLETIVIQAMPADCHKKAV